MEFVVGLSRLSPPVGALGCGCPEADLLHLSDAPLRKMVVTAAPAGWGELTGAAVTLSDALEDASERFGNGMMREAVIATASASELAR